MTKDAKRDAILEAANEQFLQYGYRKTSMDDISKRLNISRTTLYLYFDNKDDVFRGVSKSIHATALQAAEDHLAHDTKALDLAVRIERALLARHAPFQSAVIQSPHGSELFDEYSRLCGDIVFNSHNQFQTMLSTALNKATRAGEINLKAVGMSSAAAAELLNLAAAGLKHGAVDPAKFKQRVKRLVKVFVAGVR